MAGKIGLCVPELKTSMVPLIILAMGATVLSSGNSKAILGFLPVLKLKRQSEYLGSYEAIPASLSTEFRGRIETVWL